MNKLQGGLCGATPLAERVSLPAAQASLPLAVGGRDGLQEEEGLWEALEDGLPASGHHC